MKITLGKAITNATLLLCGVAAVSTVNAQQLILRDKDYTNGILGSIVVYADGRIVVTTQDGSGVRNQLDAASGDAVPGYHR